MKKMLISIRPERAFCFSLLMISLMIGSPVLFPAAQARSPLYTIDPSVNDEKAPRQSPSVVNLSLMPAPAGSDMKGVLLSLESADTLSGCPEIGPISFETKITGPTLEITVGTYEVNMRDMPDRPHISCAGQLQHASAVIPLTLDMIEENNITEIRMRMSDGRMARYSITATEQFMRLIPQQSAGMTFRTPQKEGRINPLLQWLYPDNTLALYVPEPLPEDQWQKAMSFFAKQNDLTPLHEIYPDFVTPFENRRMGYYVDSSGQLMNDVSADGKSKLGTAPVVIEEYGLEGMSSTAKLVDIFARPPM